MSIKGKGTSGGIAIVLDSPNYFAWNKQIHLWGEELKLFSLCLKQLNITKTYITYAIPYRVEDKLEEEEIQAAHFALIQELEEIAPTKILCLGGTAYRVLKNFPKKVNIKKERGRGEWVQVGKTQVYMVSSVPPYFVTSTPDLFRDFWGDLEKLVNTDTPFILPPCPYTLVDKGATLKRRLNQVAGASFIVCDVETTGLNPEVDTIEAIGLTVFTKGEIPEILIVPYYQVDAPSTRQALLSFIHSFKGKFIFHNAKFDVKCLCRLLQTSCDIFKGKFEDTLLMNYVLDERPIMSPVSPHGLKSLSRVHFDAEDFTFKFKEFWAIPLKERSWDTLYKYLGLDLFYTGKLYLKLKALLSEEQKGLLQSLLYPATLALADIELQGTPIDIPYLQEYEKTLGKDLELIAGGLQELLVKMKIPLPIQEEFNSGSYKKVATVMYTYLRLPRKGKALTDKETLNKLLALNRLHPQYDTEVRIFLSKILEHRAMKKILSSYVINLQTFAESTGSVHTSFNIPGTGTGRLSASAPALQTIPQIVGPVVRRAFIAPEGFAFVKADYSQLELRVAAWLSGDPDMIKAFRDGRDIHSEVAAAMFQVDPSEVTTKQRYAAKFVDFGLMYGRGAYSLAEGPELRDYGWSPTRAQEFIDNYLNEFPLLKRWMENQRAQVLQEQEFTTPLHRTRRWPFITRKSAATAQRQALNFPIQSIASDFTLHSLIKIHKKLTYLKSRAILIVHDEIDFLVDKDEFFVVAQIIREGMEKDLVIPSFNVPIEVDIEVGDNWADVGPIKDYFS